MPGPVPRVLLTSTTNSFEAHVIQARLASEGLDAELRGATGGGPYPFTVGGMGDVQIYVPPDQLDDARLVMLAAEVDASVGAAPQAPKRITRADVMVLAAIVAVIVVVTIARVMRIAFSG